MFRALTIAAFVLMVCPSFAQRAPDKGDAAGSSKSGQGAPVGAATIPSDMRSNASKDVPMGSGTPKDGNPTGGISQGGKRNQRRP
jgi:hypothetical protein